MYHLTRRNRSKWNRTFRTGHPMNINTKKKTSPFLAALYNTWILDLDFRKWRDVLKTVQQTITQDHPAI